ncbi:metallophosphoesterase [Lactococcus nasutitermitis]|uniref:Metallophosphoesterase n=1 Tax=Lactococcus nasutitermitis TaxID=1652957 RepID=A0ABV9JD85_9LACT|nr:metallophosphoesterase [Lactococcus nasutitermitis]
MRKKLAVISDFHMDINHFSLNDLAVFRNVLLENAVTDVHFAGDMSNDFHQLTEPFLTELSKTFSVTFNLGNHDMVTLSENEIEQSDFQVKWFGNTAFVSFHGWYDYSFMEKIDVKKIEQFKHNFYFDRKIHRDFDDIITTENILTKLSKILSGLAAKRIIIAMHFVPEKHFIINTRYEKFARFNAYLGSEHFHEIFMRFPEITDVVFGHAHHRMPPQKIIENKHAINYHARPLGYPYEWQLVRTFLQKFPHYQIDEAWQLRQQYKAVKDLTDWQNFRQKHLAEEFRSALTFFDLSD